MKKITGESISPGIALGHAFIYRTTIPKINKITLSDSQTPAEVTRYLQTLKGLRRNLVSLRKKIHRKKKARNIFLASQLLDSHLTMLDDPFFQKTIPKGIKNQGRNAEWILQDETQKLLKVFEQIEDEYLRSREEDFKEMSEKLTRRLMDIKDVDLNNIPKGGILIASDLQLTDLLKINYENLGGIVLEEGGKTSHTSILIRASSIPALISCFQASTYIVTGDFVVLDANSKQLYKEPDPAFVEEYRVIQSEFNAYQQSLLDDVEQEAKTLDNQSISILANLESVSDLDRFNPDHADGIGLFRSEFLFLNTVMPDEESQYSTYCQVLRHMKGKMVTIRTLDLGGEKDWHNSDEKKEPNPLLGIRGVRFTMYKKELFEIQLRAMLRASVNGALRILIPFISDDEEFKSVLEFIERVRLELNDEGHSIEPVSIGAMIETPSAAITADLIAKNADFLAIGTNDLTQYTLAVERENQRVDYLFNPFHLSILRLLKQVISYGKQANTPVHVCGELAGYPLATVLLLGLGVTGFSMNPTNIPLVKKIIASVSQKEAQKLADSLLSNTQSSQITTILQTWMEKNLDSIRY